MTEIVSKEDMMDLAIWYKNYWVDFNSDNYTRLVDSTMVLLRMQEKTGVSIIEAEKLRREHEQALKIVEHTKILRNLTNPPKRRRKPLRK